MKYGFVRVAAATPRIRVADCKYNVDQILDSIDKAEQKSVKVLVFPELSITGYTCGDLFLQDALLNQASLEIKRIVDYSIQTDALIVIGFPFQHLGKLYNVAGVIHKGKILGIVPKIHLPNYTEFYEARHFSKGHEPAIKVEFLGQELYFGSKILFQCANMKEFIFGVEVCEDLWVANSPSIAHSLAGATVVANLSASNELAGKGGSRRELVKGHSSKLVCGYIYSTAGEGESTTDLVFAGHNMIVESGSLLAEAEPFQYEMTVTDMDLGKILSERRRKSTFLMEGTDSYKVITFQWKEKNYLEELSLLRTVKASPFVPSNKETRQKRCQEIIMIQAHGLKTRLAHTGIKTAVLGISGGLDSTLALLVTCEAFDLLGLDRSNIYSVTMPCFGTTDRTYGNAISLANLLGTTVMEIPIRDAVELHFRDIGHDPSVHDITYENSQARERTQVLMDLANRFNGMVIGTGDMSELALGWATYNGDHMSMYGVNASIPKTLVRYLVDYYAEESQDDKLRVVLKDILDTPVSPELLPPKEGEIVQKTEDLVGPYELHDFFLFQVLRYGFEPIKVFGLAKIAFQGKYEDAVIIKWLKVFYRRFFTQQFKRSCLPDGPKVGSVSISPRGDLRMPSDASAAPWLEQLEKLNSKE